MIKPGPQYALQGRMDLGQEPADTVTDLGDLPGQVIIKPAQQSEFCQGLMRAVTVFDGLMFTIGDGRAAQAIVTATPSRSGVGSKRRVAQRRHRIAIVLP